MSRTSARHADRPHRLTPAVILDRAVAIADAEGLEALSVRRVARELGVTPMALYWHFQDKQALLYALGDRLLADLDLTVDERQPWLEQLRALVGSLTAVLRAHPSAAALIGSLPTTASEHALAATEAALDILRRGGFSPEEAAHVTRQIVRTTTSMVLARFAAPQAADDPRATRARTEAFLHSLPPERFPRIIEAAGALSATDDPDTYYELVIELLLTGIHATAAHRRRQSPRSDASAPPTLR